MASLRGVVAYDYSEVVEKRVCNPITTELPKAKEIITKIKTDLEKSP